MNKFYTYGLLGLLSISMSGCGMMTQNIVMEYNSKSEKLPSNGKICLNKFSDDRTIKNKIGTYQDGYTVEHDIITDQQVNLVISNAINDELKKQGYSVDLIDIDSNKIEKIYNQCNIIDGSIKKVFTEGTNKFLVFTYKSIITLDVKIITKSGEKLEKTYSANGESMGMTISASNSKNALDEALEKIILDITKDIQGIIKD